MEFSIKKTFACIFAAAAVLFPLSGCNDKTETPEPSNTAETTEYSATESSDADKKPERYLTNPGEYLSDLSLKINGAEFPAPCTYEELSELFVLEPESTPMRIDDWDYYIQWYDVYTKADYQYFGLVSFRFPDNGGSAIFHLFTVSDKSLYVDGHDGDLTVLTIGNIEVGASAREDVEASWGEGLDPDTGYICYYFEDCTLRIVYSEDTLIDCELTFELM